MIWPSTVSTTALPLGNGRGGRHGRGGFVFPDVLAAGEIEPVDAAVVGADEYAAASRKSSIFWRRIVLAVFLRMNSKCAHHARPPRAYRMRVLAIESTDVEV